MPKGFVKCVYSKATANSCNSAQLPTTTTTTTTWKQQQQPRLCRSLPENSTAGTVGRLGNRPLPLFAVRRLPFAIHPAAGLPGSFRWWGNGQVFFIDFLSPFLVTCASHNIYCYMLWLPCSPASHIFCYFVSLRPFPVINCKLLLPFC